MIPLIRTALLAMALAGCFPNSGQQSPPDRLVFEGRTYLSRGLGAEVPADRLTLLGMASAAACQSSEIAEHADVFGIEGIDSTVVVAAFLYPIGGFVDRPTTNHLCSPAITLFLRDGVASYPPAVCEYFDPQAVGAHGPTAPNECR